MDKRDTSPLSLRSEGGTRCLTHWCPLSTRHSDNATAGGEADVQNNPHRCGPGIRTCLRRRCDLSTHGMQGDGGRDAATGRHIKCETGVLNAGSCSSGHCCRWHNYAPPTELEPSSMQSVSDIGWEIRTGRIRPPSLAGRLLTVSPPIQSQDTKT